jgi:hypothetical protein
VTVATVQGYDATHGNIGALPADGHPAGYSTGSPWIRWTPQDWEAHPGAVRFDQDPAASDPMADALDVESGTAAPGDAPGWYRRALADFHQARRPGQRWPAAYASMDSITSVANAFVAGGITSGPGLIIADYRLTRAEAVALVANASGPFPVVGAQYQDAGLYDCDIWSVPWLENVSGKAAPPPAPLTYGRPRSLRATGGHTTVRLAWDAPGTAGLPAPAEYLVYVYSAPVADRASLVPSYPRTVTGFAFEGGGLVRGKPYIAHVVASGPGLARVRPFTYASAAFWTG